MFDINFKCIYYFCEESFSSSMFLGRFLDVIHGRSRKLERELSRQVELQVKEPTAPSDYCLFYGTFFPL